MLSLRARFLAAVLTVIVVSETVIAVSFYNQQKQHSITQELVAIAQRMHELGDFQLAVGQLALQSAPASARQISELRSMLRGVQAAESHGSASERLAADNLGVEFGVLSRARGQLDRLPQGSSRRALERTLVLAQAHLLTVTAQQVHNLAETRVRSASAGARAGERDAYQTLIVGSVISVLAAAGLALLLAGTVTRPVARLASGARHLGAGDLNYRLPVESHDEIAVVATEFNRMATQLKEASATLEERVRTRTQELAHANRELDLHRAEQARLARERSMLLGRVITAQEEERRRIARELHDETGQALTALSLGIEAATAQLRTGRHDHVEDRLESLAGVAGDAIEELERLVLDLRPAQLDRLGLVATLRWYVARARSRYDLSATLTVRGEPRRLPAEIETTLFRLTQEALTNVIRHAQATRAKVVLTFASDRLRLEVTDDGVGFEASRVASSPTSIGLIGMRERAQLIGATVAIRSHPGQGAHVSVTVPLEGAQLRAYVCS
jgi:signal transduction histidine kinase